MIKDLKDIRGVLFNCLWLIFLGFLFMALSAVFKPLVILESQGIWFQRSGSLAVICGAFSEYKLLKMSGHFDAVGLKWDIPFTVPKSYMKAYRVLTLVSLLLVVLGTVVWGYGDILFKK